LFIDDKMKYIICNDVEDTPDNQLNVTILSYCLKTISATLFH